MSQEKQESEKTAGFVDKFVRTLKKKWLVVVIAAVIGGLLGWGFSALQPRIYSSDATGVVVAGTNESTALASSADYVAKSKATQYQSLASSRNVAKKALEITGYDLTEDQALRMVSASVPLDTAQVKVTVRSTDPKAAQELADAWIEALTENVAQVENAGNVQAESNDSSDGLTTQSVIGFVSFVPANTPAAPISPNVKLLILLGTALGIFASLAYIAFAAVRDSRITSVDSLREVSDAAIIGTIPFSKSFADTRLIRADQVNAKTRRTDFRLIEAFKELRTNLQFMNPDHPPRKIVVTSSLPSDGKSTIADNLAIILSQSGNPVFLVDSDLRRPTVAKSFGIVGDVGVTDILIGKAEIDDVIQTSAEYPNLHILATGQLPPNPSELLTSDRFTAMINELAAKGMVIMDAPPLLPVTDSSILAAKFDGALVVVEAGGTKREEIEKALGNLDRVKGNLLGLVLNKVPTTGSEASRYAYYGKDYYYEESETADGSKKRSKRNK